MIIYEVNLTIHNDIFEEYYQWLIGHVGKMLTFKGFQKAELAKEQMPHNDTSKATKITVRYFINNDENLSDYLKIHALAMREEGIKKFGNKFSALRRIFTELTVIS